MNTAGRNKISRQNYHTKKQSVEANTAKKTKAQPAKNTGIKTQRNFEQKVITISDSDDSSDLFSSSEQQRA